MSVQEHRLTSQLFISFDDKESTLEDCNGNKKDPFDIEDFVKFPERRLKCRSMVKREIKVIRCQEEGRGIPAHIIQCLEII
jgi:hypothetical protein